MALTRLAGDRLAERFGPRPVILRSGLIMAAGIAGFGLAPALWAVAAGGGAGRRRLRQHLSR